MNITNIVDVIIILFILLFGVVGFKRGFIKQSVSSIGLIIILIIAFKLKDPLGNFLTLNLPFIPFHGMIKGVTALNIILYQLIAFIIVFTILQVLLMIIIKLSGIVETFLKMTIILGIPSKILGGVLGLIEGFIIVFIVLFILKQPTFNIKEINKSELTPKILNSTPLLSSFSSNTNKAITDILVLANNYKDEENKNNFNKEAIDIMLKYKIVKVELIEKLDKSDKINISNLDKLLDKYR